MRNIQPVESYIEIVEAYAPANHLNVIKVGVRRDSFQHLLHRNLSTFVAEFYGLIQPGLLSAMHAFRGVKRPLLHAGNAQADSSVIVYSWRPEMDYVWSGSPTNGRPTGITPPPNRVFVVLGREQPTDECGVECSIEHWNWVAEDPHFPHAPVDWEERYAKRLWSRTL